ncbi:hypothetical protein GGTG_10126 [Gaeumannomyces tritici R3-111a-1]|uniref:Uncharacterized protein n=1 Tax=Gaeumannomyces tritici (strain R3-111a-1) TaxID=644352 RepID=J3P9E4_GAET3|nr:hypothetical protein GGTG_10126 [Gaeumannomyces tritici R3-111a-1]EJT73280.1 hypothetical protein GGTG_10126 [Gaeumannomyces tritici R3-111a-1]
MGQGSWFLALAAGEGEQHPGPKLRSIPPLLESGRSVDDTDWKGWKGWKGLGAFFPLEWIRKVAWRSHSGAAEASTSRLVAGRSEERPSTASYWELGEVRYRHYSHLCALPPLNRAHILSVPGDVGGSKLSTWHVWMQGLDGAMCLHVRIAHMHDPSEERRGRERERDRDRHAYIFADQAGGGVLAGNERIRAREARAARPQEGAAGGGGDGGGGGRRRCGKREQQRKVVGFFSPGPKKNGPPSNPQQDGPGAVAVAVSVYQRKTNPFHSWQAGLS